MSVRIGKSRHGERLGLLRTVRRIATAWTIAGLKTVAALLPARCDRWVARGLTTAVRCLAPGLERRIHDHLRFALGRSHSVPSRRALAELVIGNLGRFASEWLRLGQLGPADLRRRSRIYGQIHLRRALDEGRGALLVTAHYSNFEWLAACCGAYGLHITVVARAGDADLIEQAVSATRSQHNITVVHKLAWRQALKALRQGGIVGMLADQAVNTGGVMVEFLDHPATMAPGPILLARQTGAHLLPAFGTRDLDGRMTVEIHPRIELPESGDEEADLRLAAQQLSSAISAQIRHRPDEWFWMHRRWKPPVKLRSNAPKLDRALRDDD
ncbi:MAG: lysophospholipid acyltransferase family protein [Fimbriimonadaceae bacterium]|nr:lysophospholipid acyltransferase family protein [Fimbriimonadaceae bacterium]